MLRLKHVKIDFGWGSAPDPLGELTALPRPPSWIIRALLLRKGRGRGGKEKEGSEEKGGEGNGGKGKGDLPYDLGDLEMTWLP